MPIGTVLVQPQKLHRAAGADADAALIQDFLTLAASLATDPPRAAPLVAVFGEAMEAVSVRMQQRLAGGFAGAQQRLRAWLQPALDLAKSVGKTPLPMEGPASAGLDLSRQLLFALADLARALTLDRIRGHVSLLLDVVQNDLGLSSAFIDEQIWVLIDDVITRLEQIPPNTARPAREDRLETAVLLRRLRRRFRGQFAFPALTAEQVAKPLFELLQEIGLDPLLRRTACVAERLGDALEAAAPLVQVIPFPGTGSRGGLQHEALVFAGGGTLPGGPAPEGDPYAWYATWLLQYKDDYLLGLSDLKDPKNLASRLKDGGDPLSRYLREQLPAETRLLLENYATSGEPSPELQLAILTGLNVRLRGPSLIDEAQNAGVTLKAETRHLHDQSPQGDDLIRLNRMILEDAYDKAIERFPRSFLHQLFTGFPDGFGAAVGDLWGSVVDGLGEAVSFPGDRVYVDDAHQRVFHGDKPVFQGANVTWNQAPIFDTQAGRDGQKFYLFNNISPETMEGIAYYSSCAADGIRFIWHLTKFQSGHQVAPILYSAYDLTHLIVKIAAKRPFSGFDFFSHKWLDWMLGGQLFLTTGGSFQGIHTQASFGNCVIFWFTVWAGDLLNMIGPISLTNSLRDALLTSLTLYNFGGPQDGPSTLPERPAENHNEIDGLVSLSVFGFTYLLAKQVDRRDYVNPTKMPGKVAALWIFGGLGMGLLAGFVGTLVAEIVAWAEDWKLLGLTMLKSIPKVWLSFWPLLYSAREGDTDDGKFNPAGAAFRGYPDKNASPSPYSLPYAAGQALYCGQGNAGMWSHNRIFNPTPAQTYAFDFGHDQGDEVLASRPGTVVNFGEATPDDSTGTWNFIIIRHDVDDNGAPIAPDQAHDLDVNGQVVMTFAVYGHGKQNGVTAAFARWTPPVVPVNNVTRVKRGQPIMLADDTGTSFHSHLHMHVQAETLPRPASGAVRNNAYTIPFVYQDVSGDGVCQHLEWYQSSNTRRTS